MSRLIGIAAVAGSLFISSNAIAQSEYVTIELEIDIDAPAEHVWETVGGYCDIQVWAPGLACEITSGDGGIGTVRSLMGGFVTEVLVAQTELSYGYMIEPTEGTPWDGFHGNMEARPVTDETSKIIYTLMIDLSIQPDQAAKDAEVARRRGMFEPLLVTMKELSEAE